MDVTDLAHRLRRRRWAVAVVVLLAIAAAAGGALTASSSQQSAATVVIVPPPLGDAVSDQNPLLNLDNNLAQLATVLAGALQSSEVSDDMASKGASGSFSVSTVTGTNPSFAQLSPQLVFTVTASTGSAARRTAGVLVAETRTQLATLQEQASVPASARASIVQVVAPTTPVAAGSGGLRTGASYGLAVVVLGLLFVLLVDHLLIRRTLAPARTDAAQGAGPRDAAEPTTRATQPAAPRDDPAGTVPGKTAVAETAPAKTTATETAPAKTAPTKTAAAKTAPAKTAAAKSPAGPAAASKYPAAKGGSGGSGRSNRRRGQKSSGRSR